MERIRQNLFLFILAFHDLIHMPEHPSGDEKGKKRKPNQCQRNKGFQVLVSPVLMFCLKLNPQDTYHFSLIIQRKITDKDISPACMDNPVRIHLLSVQRPVHITIDLFFDQISRIPEILAAKIQTVHHIDVLTLFILFCCIKITDPCSLSYRTEHSVKNQIGFFLHILFGLKI